MAKFKVEIEIKAFIIMEVEAADTGEAQDKAVQDFDIREIGGDSECGSYFGVRGKENTIFLQSEAIINVEAKQI